MTNLAEALLGPLLSADRMGPRITYYDDATGERIELSTVTLANWAAKTANLLRDELGAGPGSRVAVLLPAHWQTVAVVLGVWWIGAEVVLIGTSGPAASNAGSADVALCTADRLAEADELVGAGEVAVLSLDPFGKPAPGLPIGVTDFATAVRLHGDQVHAETSPGAALNGRAPDDVLAGALEHATAAGLVAGDRVMSARPWFTPDELVTNLLAVLAARASLIQLANPDSGLLARRRETEKVTRLLE